MNYPQAPEQFKDITGDDLKAGMTIVERTERGAVRNRIPVTDVGPCRTDPDNIHVFAHSVLCYARLATIEIQL